MPDARTHSRKCLEYDKKEANQLSSIFCLFTALSAISAIINDQWISIDGHELDDLTDEGFFFATTINVTNSSLLLEPVHSNFGQIVPCTNVGARLFWTPATFGNYADDNRDYDSYHLKGNIVLINCVSPMVAFYFYLGISFCFVMVIFSVISTLLHCFVSPYKFIVWLKEYVIFESFCVILTPVICFLTFAAKREIESMRPTSKVTLGSGIFYVLCGGAFSFVAALISLHKKFELRRTRRADNQKLICSRSLRSWRNAVTQQPEPRAVALERYLLNSNIQRPSDASSNTYVEQPFSDS
ncbi:hypothetical protein DdX_02124 [Ditylenchus destructor]|uniref:Transmembrane protein 127 transmembrane region domain-containing protein n=1 Tax=Ditylenchus destructor TaxID=166010 RepID=A0AAD4NH23_9BILA|nr:hypothetical protein DdX_02124 [Ditylenchus destructor]